MKVAVKVEEVEREGLLALLTQRVLIFGLNYIYEGKLVGVNETCLKLEDAYIVYETGAFTAKTYTDKQKLPTDFWYVQLSAIESFGIGK